MIGEFIEPNIASERTCGALVCGERDDSAAALPRDLGGVVGGESVGSIESETCENLCVRSRLREHFVGEILRRRENDLRASKEQRVCAAARSGRVRKANLTALYAYGELTRLVDPSFLERVQPRCPRSKRLRLLRCHRLQFLRAVPLRDRTIARKGAALPQAK